MEDIFANERKMNQSVSVYVSKSYFRKQNKLKRPCQEQKVKRKKSYQKTNLKWKWEILNCESNNGQPLNKSWQP